MIHVVTGPPCAGKSTYVQEHAKDGDIFVDYDMIAKAIGKGRSHMARGHIKTLAFSLREKAIDYLLKNPEAESWVIHTRPKEEWIKAYKDAGAEFINIESTLEECLARAEKDERPQQTIDAIYEYFLMQKGRKMNVKRKVFEAKADNGIITGYASTWIREPDSYGDVVAKGAFAESIEQIITEGKAIPLLFNHKGDDLAAYIGTVYELKEDDHGLYFEASFDDTPEAQRARELSKDGRLAKFSFSYDTLEQAEVTLEDGRRANELRKLNIHEISLVLYPANRDTSVLSVKSANEKAGRRNSAKDADDLRKAIQLIQGVLGELDDTEDEAKSEEPDTANDEERTRLLEKAKSLLEGMK